MNDDLGAAYFIGFDPANDTIQPVVTRVVSTGPTTFTYKGEPIAWLDNFEPIPQDEPIEVNLKIDIVFNDAVQPGTAYLMPDLVNAPDPVSMWDEVKRLYDQYAAATAPRTNWASSAMDLGFYSIEPLEDRLRRIDPDCGPIVTYVEIGPICDALRAEAEQEAAIERLLANDPDPEPIERKGRAPWHRDEQQDIIDELVGSAYVSDWTEDWYDTTPWGSTAKAPKLMPLLKAQIIDYDYERDQIRDEWIYGTLMNKADSIVKITGV